MIRPERFDARLCRSVFMSGCSNGGGSSVAEAPLPSLDIDARCFIKLTDTDSQTMTLEADLLATLEHLTQMKSGTGSLAGSAQGGPVSATATGTAGGYVVIGLGGA